MLPILGLRNDSSAIRVDCSDQMRARPITFLVDALQQLGMKIQYVNADGKFPLIVSGRLSGGKAVVSGLSSQYISALLLALPLAEKESSIEVKNLLERPYLNMSLQYLSQQKIQYAHLQEKTRDYFSLIGQQVYQPFHKIIPGDFSSASYLIAAGTLLGGSLILTGLDDADLQADKALIPQLQKMGAAIRMKNLALHIPGPTTLNRGSISLRDTPDLLPTLAVIGTRVRDSLCLTHIEHARIKETDRIHSMMTGLKKLGARIEMQNNCMKIYRSELQVARVNFFHDHRTVMALSLAGLIASSSTLIENRGHRKNLSPLY